LRVVDPSSDGKGGIAVETQLSQHESDGALEIELLLSACKNGDSSAWEVLLDRYERLVFAIAIREGLSREDAADVTQASFEALITALPRIETGTSVGAWLACVARRLAWRQRERRRREDSTLRRNGHQLIVSAGQKSSPWCSPPDDVDADAALPDDRVLELYERLLGMGEPCRTMLTSLYLDPKKPTYAEVAASTGRPVGSIGPTRARCLQRLRSLVTFEAP
jgi:RNA polymerase sigma factor (sigma-70 family)